MTGAEKPPAAPIHQAVVGVHLHTGCARAGIEGRLLKNPIELTVGWYWTNLDSWAKKRFPQPTGLVSGCTNELKVLGSAMKSTSQDLVASSRGT